MNINESVVFVLAVIKQNVNLYINELCRNMALLLLYIQFLFSSSWMKNDRCDSFIKSEELITWFILRVIFGNYGHKSYSDIQPLPLCTSLCICDGGRIDSWQKTPPSVFPPPDTLAVSVPEIRERLASVWLCNLHSEELSSTWMWAPVLKRCILDDASAFSIPTNHFVTGMSPDPEHLYMCSDSHQGTGC